MCVYVCVCYFSFNFNSTDFYPIHVSIVRIWHFCRKMMVFVFSTPFGSIYQARTYIPRQNPPTSTNMVYNGVGLNKTISSKFPADRDSLPLTYSSYTKLLLIPRICFLISLLMLIIDTIHSTIRWDQHWIRPSFQKVISTRAWGSWCLCRPIHCGQNGFV